MEGKIYKLQNSENPNRPILMNMAADGKITKFEPMGEHDIVKAVEKYPDRFIGIRNKAGVLVEVHDTDTGVVWQKIGEQWHWVV